VSILDSVESGPIRQFTASVRADARFNDDLQSYGLTAEIRLQF